MSQTRNGGTRQYSEVTHNVHYASVWRRPLHSFDYEDFDGSPRRFQLQTELLLQRDEQCRIVGPGPQHVRGTRCPLWYKCQLEVECASQPGPIHDGRSEHRQVRENAREIARRAGAGMDSGAERLKNNVTHRPG